MFGYRLLRDADYSRLLTAADAKDAEIHRLNDVIVKMHERVTSTTSEARSKATMADLMAMRANVLEREAATMRQKLTGLPQIAPEVGKGSPLSSDAMGAGFALLEDVGDAAAEDLIRKGLLHDEDPGGAMPSAAALTDGFGAVK
jgi:hypothetical protein